MVRCSKDLVRCSKDRGEMEQRLCYTLYFLYCMFIRKLFAKINSSCWKSYSHFNGLTKTATLLMFPGSILPVAKS